MVCVTCVVTSSCNQPAQTEAAASSFCDSLEAEFESANASIGVSLWRNLRDGSSLESLRLARQVWYERLNSMGALGRIDKYQRVSKDSLTIQRLQVSRKRILGALLENDPDISLITDSLRREALVEVATPPASFSVLATDTIPLLYRRREVYHQLVGARRDFSSAITRLARLRNQSCQKLGYNSLLDLNLELSGLTKDDLNQTLAEIDSTTVGRYKGLLKRIADTLSHRSLEEADLYFYEYKIASRYRRDFSRSKALDFALKTISDLGIDIRYRSVFVDSGAGLAGAPLLVAPHPPDDIRVLYKTRVEDGALKVGSYEIPELLLKLGQSVQLLSSESESYLLREPAEPLWSRCSGELFVSLLNRRGLQRKYARIPEGQFDQYEASVGDVRLLRLRRLLLMVRLELELYDNPNRDLTEVYHKLVSEVLLVKPDKQFQYWTSRRELLLEPARHFARLYSQLIVAQIYSTALREYGALANNPQFGSYLQNAYFASGSRIDWSDLVLLGTGERLDSKYFLDRFAVGSQAK